VAEYAKHVYHLYVIRVKNRQHVIEALNKHAVASGVHYPIPLHRQKAYQYLGYEKGSFPVAETCAHEILSLPIFPEMIDKEVFKVASALSSACDHRANIFHHVSK
jgi:dTDP-4-amino-4,6-dideoxygalactose transaminase